jgi:hypothetical protein
MKIIAILFSLFLLAGPGLAYSALMESPDTLKITMQEPYKTTIITAWQNQTSGIWTVAYVDSITENVKMFIGNATGYVKIT